ncbi:MAG: ubiquitin-like domain-containing protein [Acutalibacteraceae bacterium]|nr:ubiquitin-like domain-containing protein [Acutalibacteraceae bacterium]MEE3373967.1 ubiquitin-like domain-containing protein [Acutalibacteraceae bacterium]
MSQQDRKKFLTLLTSRVAAVALMVVGCCAAMVGYATTTYTVNVFADGQVIPVKTSARNPDSIVAQTGITVGEDDLVDKSSFRVGSDAKDGNAIIVYRAVPVTFYEKGKKVMRVNAAGTVADALEKAGIDMEGADTTDLDPDTLLKKNMKINILRSFKIQLVVGGVKRTVDYAAGTVGDLLKRVNVDVGKYDVVKPGLSETLKRGSKVVVKRVSYETREEEKVIKYGTQTKETGILAQGVKRVARQGRDGTKTVTYEDKIVNGKVVSSKKVGEVVNVKAVDKVVVIGTRGATNVVTSNIQGSGAPTSYLKTFHGPATAYTAKAGAKTASGAVARRGLVAVNPKQIPYGSKLYIVADDGTVYGYCTAADTGGFVTNGSGTLVDLYMDSYGECTQWGKRNVTIYVISWGDGRV